MWVWGASRISRRRARILESQGVRIETYIDTKKSRQLDKEVIYYEDLPAAGKGFILTYIRQMDNREKIQAFLEEKGYVERDRTHAAHFFSPTLSREAYAGSQLEELADKLTAGSFAPLLTHLVEAKKVSREDIAELRAILDERPDEGGDA